MEIGSITNSYQTLEAKSNSQSYGGSVSSFAELMRVNSVSSIIQELKNWKIYDYGSFIDKTLFQLKKDISNPNTSEDGKYYLLKKLPYYEDLKINYNKVINEPKYA